VTGHRFDLLRLFRLAIPPGDGLPGLRSFTSLKSSSRIT
jgi:hypothetical protein